MGSLILRFCGTGEEIKEPEVDLSNFLARQRLDDAAGPSVFEPVTEPGEDEVDHSLAHLKFIGSQSTRKPMKGRVETVEWDEELENLSREKAAADANRGTKQMSSVRITCIKLYEILSYHRSQIKVPFERSEAAGEQVFSPTLMGSEQRQGPTTIVCSISFY